MTQIDDILELVRTGAIIPETYTAILAREVERLREASLQDAEERSLLGHLHMVALDFVNEADPAQRRAAAHLVQAVAALGQYYLRHALKGAAA